MVSACHIFLPLNVKHQEAVHKLQFITDILVRTLGNIIHNPKYPTLQLAAHAGDGQVSGASIYGLAHEEG